MIKFKAGVARLAAVAAVAVAIGAWRLGAQDVE